jgi:hypothetical protein
MATTSNSSRRISCRLATFGLAAIALPLALNADLGAHRVPETFVTKLTAPNQTGICGQAVQFEGALMETATHGPLGGRTLVFYAASLFNASVPTDPQGRATYLFTVGDHQKAGDYPFSVSFGGTGGDQGLQPSKASATFVVKKAPTRISISDFGQGAPGIAIGLIREHDQRRISGHVAVTVNGAPFKTVSKPLTNITPPGAGPWTIACQFVGDDSYLPSSASKTVHR